ncbi:haloacid dehalogenase [Xylaria bambusicola]|uniref:haloacid dehalogenase n=1 Tax=Xylaria bambusicola TaxID=326684 RepID=UPI002008DDF4|nr:haloacid dehalogenase [Xylaria bambusicola]KAI0505417.1 haloacid dehalogenase [Xylaria bambusicola]
MESSEKVVIAFDLYGTLLSTDSIADELATIYGGDKAQSLATVWRRYQLEYTWRINSMGQYKSFSEITRNALAHAVAEHGLTLAVSDAARLMTAYDALHVFPEIPAAMKLLQGNKDAVSAHIFSNGTDQMVGSSIRTSPELSPHADIFQSLITVDGLRCFKPDPRTYAHLVEQSGKKGHPGDVWVVSANPFDVAGAKAAGLKSAFIDRQGQGWIDRLDEMYMPTLIAGGVDQAIKSILNY